MKWIIIITIDWALCIISTYAVRNSKKNKLMKAVAGSDKTAGAEMQLGRYISCKHQLR